MGISQDGVNGMKIDRLLRITIYLLNHGRTSSAVLADYFEVSQRTIMRDIDTLCLAGIPVCSTTGVDGGYEIMEHFKMQSQVAGQLDYSYVICALQGLASAYENKDVEATLEKVKSLTNGKNHTMIFDLSVAHENRNTNEMLYILNKYIQDKQVIQFIYTNALDETKEVVVDPISTLYKWYNWYLIGYSRKHQDYRLYKVVRMDQLSTLGEEKCVAHDLNKVQEILQKAEENRKTIRILMKCNKKLNTKCREYFKATILEIDENGDFECEIIVPEEEQFWYGILLSFKNEVQVMEPPELIERIKEDCKDILRVYQL